MIRRGLIVGAAVVGVLAVVWVVPRELDWTQYRGQITALAAKRLGRPVAIAGDVRLTILPQPVLTAWQISVTDPVTGAVFTAREMQLRVGLFGLLVGRIDPEALDLDQAVVRLPWPMAPDGFKMRPPPAFAATIHNGTLLVGNAGVSAIDGTLATYGDDGAVNVFGTAHVGGGDWGFEGNLGPIGADHESVLSAIFTGEGDTDGAMLRVNGEVRDDGGLAGDIAASGPDLSRVLPAPKMRFGAEAKIAGAGSVLTGSDLTLELDGVDGHGGFRWQAGDPGFQLRLSTTRLDLDRWVGVWLQPAGSGGSSRFDVSAAAAQLDGGLLRNLHIDFERGRRLIVHDFSATLPGEAAFHASGGASFTGSTLHIDDGSFAIKTADITPSWSWLAAADPDLPGLPGWAPIAVDLSGKLAGSASALSLSGVAGTVGGLGVSGSMGWARAARTRINADVAVDQLPLDGFGALTLSPRLDYDLRVAAKSAGYGGVTAQNLQFHLVRNQAGTTLSGTQATILGAVVTGGLTAAADGTITGATITAAAPSLSPLLARLPKSGWQGTTALASTPASLTAEFKGPLKSLTGTIKLDAGETELTLLPVIDWPDRTATGALTLRNPGAWRLVSLLGGPDVEPWVGVGSLGLIARFNAKPGHLGVDYLDLAFGGMRLGGGLVFDQAGDRWALTGQLHSSRLPVAWPKLAGNTQIPTGWITGGSGHIALTADNLTFADAPVASGLHANLTLADGVLGLADFGVKLGAGAISGTMGWRALDPEPSASLAASFSDIALDGPVLGGSLDLMAGNLAGKIDLSASGHTPTTMLATLSGDFDATVTSGSLSGFDLAKAQAAVALAGGAKPLAYLQTALKSGTSSFDQLHVAAAIKDGGLSITTGTLTGAENADLSGLADLPGSALDLGMVLHLAGAPPVAARYKGPLAAPAMTVDLTGLKKWLAQQKKSKAKGKR